MGRLIDADVLIEGRVSNDPVVIAAKRSPTVDAVQVVRCKDCLYGIECFNGPGNLRMCEHTGRLTKENWFCALGEREER